jgi:hypothetical protein
MTADDLDFLENTTPLRRGVWACQRDSRPFPHSSPCPWLVTDDPELGHLECSVCQRMLIRCTCRDDDLLDLCSHRRPHCLNRPPAT